MASQTLSHDIAQVAREKLGFRSLHPGQEEAVQAILAGRDTLVVQPTGSGKSAIYQIAGLLIDGATVIVSPLIALQKDQADWIAEQKPADAAVVNSTQRASDIRERYARLKQGEIEYFFLSPEQLSKPETIEHLKSANVSLLVVDEAHCVSEWGHDFRPDYLRIGNAIETLGHPRVLALTATATPEVRQEIVKRLGMRRPKVFVRGFDRPNIYLRVDHFKTLAEKRDALVHRTRWADKPGIVYTATRRAAEEIVRALAEEGVDALFYHAGLKGSARHAIQERFMNGDAEVIVATNAFGMGVDKPNIRFVYHYDAPDSLDAYYQEIGRAGRDGKKAEAALFYRGADIGAQMFKVAEGRIGAEVLREIAAGGGSGKLSKRKLASALQRLAEAGLPSGDVEEAVQAASDGQERREQAKRKRIEQLRAYAETTGCRRQRLLEYLGDKFQGPCDGCDNCEAAAGRIAVDPSVGTRREVV